MNFIKLDELAKKYRTDKSSLDHGYTRIYADFISKLGYIPKKLLELGIYTTTNPGDLDNTGASLKTWAEFFPDLWARPI